MTTALQQALEQITALTEALDPDEQACAAEKLQALADKMKRDREWQTLLATPASPAFLDELCAEALAEYAAGETIPGQSLHSPAEGLADSSERRRLDGGDSGGKSSHGSSGLCL